MNKERIINIIIALIQLLGVISIISIGIMSLIDHRYLQGIMLVLLGISESLMYIDMEISSRRYLKIIDEHNADKVKGEVEING